jgi:hypothetical protein
MRNLSPSDAASQATSLDDAARIDLYGPELAELAARINAEHDLCVASATQAVARAIEVGRLLAEAKGQVRHGEWAGWVVEHCSFGIREAQRYMRAYDNRGALEEQMRHGVSHLTGLRGAMEALSLPEPKAPEAGPDSGPRQVPITEVKAEHRHWLCEQWWDVRAQYTLMLDAAGWDAGDIADFLGRPTEDIEAILDPRPCPRRFTKWEDGGCLIDGDDHAHEETYAASVAYVIDGWLEEACRVAALKCDGDGFGDAGPILRAGERRYRRRREAAERRGIGQCPWWYADVKPKKVFGQDHGREHSGFATSLALRQCVLADARHAVRVDVRAEEGRWSPDLMEMWIPQFKELEGLEEELWPRPLKALEAPGADETPGS